MIRRYKRNILIPASAMGPRDSGDSGWCHATVTKATKQQDRSKAKLSRMTGTVARGDRPEVAVTQAQGQTWQQAKLNLPATCRK